jgi:sugar phosphate isomerase/epimerase
MMFERRSRSQKSRTKNRRRRTNAGNQKVQGDQRYEREVTEVAEIAEQSQLKGMEILEFSCLYRHISHGINSLERVYEEKKRKYAELAKELKNLQREQVRVTAVIDSSMGAIYDPGLKDLLKILRCNDKQMRKVGRKLLETVIVDSLAI